MHRCGLRCDEKQAGRTAPAAVASHAAQDSCGRRTRLKWHHPVGKRLAPGAQFVMACAVDKVRVLLDQLHGPGTVGYIQNPQAANVIALGTVAATSSQHDLIAVLVQIRQMCVAPLRTHRQHVWCVGKNGNPAHGGALRVAGWAYQLSAAITSAGACTSSISTPSPAMGNSSLLLGCRKVMS